MYIGLLSDSLEHEPRQRMLDLCMEWGIRGVEFATGNFSPSPHLNLEELLTSEPARRALRQELRERGLTLTALNCSGNPLHPDAQVGPLHARVVRQTIELAALLEVDTVVTMSGCPGSPGGGDVANWIVGTWPADFVTAVEWQWREHVIPFWQETAAFAQQRGITRLALEMHPGQSVYNPATLLRLREAVGPSIGANFDPSHLFWQGIDPVLAVRRLGDAIYHVHAKDTRIDEDIMRQDGILHLALGQPTGQWPWAFRTLGLGHDAFFWRQFADTLRYVGYAGPLSIEHEDNLLEPTDGVLRSVRILQECL